MKYLYGFIIFLFSTSIMLTQQVEKSKYGTFLIENGTIVSVTNGTYKGSVLIVDGKIAELGMGISSPEATIIDASGQYVYPGMIDGGTHIGLGEIGAVSLTQDYNEIGDFIPNMEALTAINPSSVNIPVNRVSGVTTALSRPSGGLFPGTAALINLHGYTPAQMYAGFKGLILNFPSGGKRGRFDKRSKEDIEKDGKKAIEKLDNIWTNVIDYAHMDSIAQAQGINKNNYNPQMDALLSVIRKEVTLLINVNKKGDILAAIKWLKEKDFRVILTGLAEGWRVAGEISESGFPVITGPVLANPRRASDPYDINYKNASIMAKAGVLVAIQTMGTENVRNLPYNAGFAAAYGMGTEEALKAITINPAKIFGLDNKLGSIEKGKIANIFIATGDPFETKTQIRHLFINGWKIPMESRHTLLYDEFLERSPGLSK